MMFGLELRATKSTARSFIGCLTSFLTYATAPTPTTAATPLLFAFVR